jgi:hypothetical protein
MQPAALVDRHVLIGVYRYDQLAGLTSVTTLDGEMPLDPSVTGAAGQDVAVFGYSKVRFDLG